MAASEPASNYRGAMTQHEKCLRDLAHEVILAGEDGALPPSVFSALSNAAVDCGELLDHYRGQPTCRELSRTCNEQSATLRARSIVRMATGFITLAGISVRSSIVLVDFIRHPWAAGAGSCRECKGRR